MRNLSYVPSVDEATANRDLGVMRDVSAPGQQDGTPIRQDYMNDLYYGFRAILKRVGMTPDDSQEGVVTSQIVDALVKNIKSVQSLVDANTTFDTIFNDTDIYFSPTADRTADIATNGASRNGNVFTLYNSSTTYKVTLTYYSSNTFTVLPNEYIKLLWNGARWIIIDSNSQEFIGWEDCFYSMSRTAEISATTKIYELTITGDKTAYFKEGKKIKFTQDATTKYAIITYVEYTGGNTVLTVFSGMDYVITANAITNVKLNKMHRPYDWDNDETKWSITYSPTTYTVSNFTSATWYYTNNTFFLEKGNWRIRNNNITAEVSASTSSSTASVAISYSDSNKDSVNPILQASIRGLDISSFSHNSEINIKTTTRKQKYIMCFPTVGEYVTGRFFSFILNKSSTYTPEQTIVLTPCAL